MVRPDHGRVPVRGDQVSRERVHATVRDTVKLLRAEVVAYFLDADAKFNGDGSYKLTQK